MIEKNQRIIIQKVALIEDSQQICVELKYDDNIYKGSAVTNATSAADQLLAATKATVNAVNTIIPTPIVKRLVEIQEVKFESLNEPAVIALVCIEIKGQESFFLGAVKTDGSLLHAGVRAVLAAVNRPIALLI
jgi:hypothetical protein